MPARTGREQGAWAHMRCAACFMVEGRGQLGGTAGQELATKVMDWQNYFFVCGFLKKVLFWVFLSGGKVYICSGLESKECDWTRFLDILEKLSLDFIYIFRGKSMLWCANLPLVRAQFDKRLAQVFPYLPAVIPGYFPMWSINQSLFKQGNGTKLSAGGHLIDSLYSAHPTVEGSHQVAVHHGYFVLH